MSISYYYLATWQQENVLQKTEGLAVSSIAASATPNPYHSS